MEKDRCDSIAATPEGKCGHDMRIVPETCVRKKRMTEESTRFAVYVLGLVFIDVPMSGTFPTPAPALQTPFANLVPSDPSLKNQKNGYRGWEQREGRKGER